MENIIAKTSADTEKIGADFAQKLKPGDIIFLYGDLGYGKTTFVKGVAKGLGIAERIMSPTFTLVRQHDVHVKNQNQKVKVLYHVDLYRLDNVQEIKSIGLEDIMNDTSAVTFIEWPEKLGDFPVYATYTIHFKIIDNDNREIVFDSME